MAIRRITQITLEVLRIKSSPPAEVTQITLEVLTTACVPPTNVYLDPTTVG
jgi:hypothetical protein